jgi:PAS domain S-box-containing protein
MVAEIQDYAIIFLDIEGFISDWNAAAEKIKGYSAEEIIGKHFRIFYFPEDQQEGLPEKLLHIARTEDRAQHEGWRKRKDGTRFWGNITITALHDDENNVIGFVKVTRDLTEKKLAEERLRMSEERYHRMIAEVQDYAMILLSEDGIVQNWNAGAEKIKGYKADEIVGKRFELFYTAEDRARNLPGKLLAIARAEGKATQEGWRIRKDGTRFWGTIVITALHNEKNEVIGFSKVTRDLTEKKLAEEKLIAYTNELEVQNKELEQFAYVASHDLQEPLRKIRVFTELIEDSLDDRELVVRYLGKLNFSARRMSDLIRSLLNFSRLTKSSVVMEPVNLNAVLLAVMQDMELLIIDKDAVIVSTELPEVMGYRLQLEQLFSNLLGNALKFNVKTPVVRIHFREVERFEIPGAPGHLLDRPYYHITVEDNGIGFEPQYANKIFDLFQRLHEKHEYEGTGIGLPLCRKIVEIHKGHMFAESRPGDGARFHLFLPHTGNA